MATVYPSNLLTRPIVRKAAVPVTNGLTTTVFTVTGRIMLWAFYGRVTTVIGAGATQLGAGVGVSGICDVSPSIANKAVNSLLSITGLNTDPMLVSSDEFVPSMTTPLIIGGNIIVATSIGGTTGAIDWYAAWDPMEAGATLVAA